MGTRHAVKENFWHWIPTLCLVAALAMPTAGVLAQDPDCVDYADQPRFLTTLPLAAGDAAQVAVLGSAAYVRVASTGFVVVDWSDPTDPQTVTVVATTAGSRALAVGDGALYALDGPGNLVVFDLTDPLALVPLGQVAGAAEANGLCIAGSHAYLALAAGGLQVIDLTDPLAPVAGLQVPLTDGNGAVAVYEDRAYVVGNGYLDHDFGVFHAVDLTDPALPVPLGSYATDGTGSGYADIYFDVCAGREGVFVTHVSWWYDWDTDTNYVDSYLREFIVDDPANPGPGSWLAHGGSSMVASLVGGVAVVGTREHGIQSPWPECSFEETRLEVHRCDRLGDLSILSKLPLPAEPQDAIWAEDHVFVACGGAGLAIFSAPMLNPELPEPPERVFPLHEVAGERAGLSGDRLAVAWHHEGGAYPGDESWGSLKLYEIGAGEPVVLDGWSAQYWGLFNTMIFVGDDHLYADRSIFSLTGDVLTFEGFIPGGPAYLRGLANGYLLGFQDGQLRSWDVSDPLAPTVADGLTGNWRANLAAHADHAYAGVNFSLEIIRVGADGSLTNVGSAPLPFIPQSVTCDGTWLAVGSTDGQLAIYSVTDAVNLTWLTELDLGARILDVTLGTQLYLAVEEFGWAVVDLGADAGPSVVGWLQGANPVQVLAEGDHLVLVDACPREVWLGRQACPGDPLAVPDQTAGLPGAPLVQIDDAWPNPANPRISLAFTLARAAAVHADVVDIAGRRVATMALGHREAGQHLLQWDGRGDDGRDAASGVYLVLVRAAGESAARKVLLAR